MDLLANVIHWNLNLHRDPRREFRNQLSRTEKWHFRKGWWLVHFQRETWTLSCSPRKPWAIRCLNMLKLWDTPMVGYRHALPRQISLLDAPAKAPRMYCIGHPPQTEGPPGWAEILCQGRRQGSCSTQIQLTPRSDDYCWSSCACSASSG